MRKTLLTVLLVTIWLNAALSQASAAVWSTDYGAALARAQAENKTVLIYFSGSDWCGPCMQLNARVFNTPEFDAFAQQSLVLLQIDFPRKKKLDPALAAQNRKLAEQFEVDGFPTYFFLDGSGGIQGSDNQRTTSVQQWIVDVRQQVSLSKPRSGVVAAAKPNQPGRPVVTDFRSAGIPVKEVKYDTLALKGVTGSASRRMALINNETFLTGETHRVRLGSSSVKVTCLSMTETSAQVMVDGEKEPRDLQLKGQM